MNADIFSLAQQVGAALRTRDWMLVVAESCTGGGLAEAITRVPGSSKWFDRGFVVYSEIAKREMLGIDTALLAQCGAVSEMTAREMARGALARSHAHLAVAVTGTAGPDGGTPDVPVGTVCLAWCTRSGIPIVETRHYSGDREAVRGQTVSCALRGALNLAIGRDA